MKISLPPSLSASLFLCCFLTLAVHSLPLAPLIWMIMSLISISAALFSCSLRIELSLGFGFGSGSPLSLSVSLYHPLFLAGALAYNYQHNFFLFCINLLCMCVCCCCCCASSAENTIRHLFWQLKCHNSKSRAGQTETGLHLSALFIDQYNLRPVRGRRLEMGVLEQVIFGLLKHEHGVNECNGMEEFINSYDK